VFDLPLRIGSARENDIVLVSDGISRNHCLLQREGRSIVLVDTNSEFGTFVNGARVTRQVLEEDDVIRLGADVELAYEGR
jgi:pSer/pThr/pTyr-binding forkhead associated (FHA) protein